MEDLTLDKECDNSGDMLGIGDSFVKEWMNISDLICRGY